MEKYTNKVQGYSNFRAGLYKVVLGQCTKALQDKLKSHSGFPRACKDGIALLTIIKTLTALPRKVDKKGVKIFGEAGAQTVTNGMKSDLSEEAPKGVVAPVTLAPTDVSCLTGTNGDDNDSDYDSDYDPAEDSNENNSDDSEDDEQNENAEDGDDNTAAVTGMA